MVQTTLSCRYAAIHLVYLGIYTREEKMCPQGAVFLRFRSKAWFRARGCSENVSFSTASNPPVMKPRILLLDEPLSALDGVIKESIKERIKTIAREYHLTTIIVTHDPEEALTLSDRVLIIDGGRIAQYGQPSEIIHRPNNDFGRALGNSFRVSAAAAVLATTIAFVIAYAIHYTRIARPLKQALQAIATLPMYLPTITYGFAIIYSFGKQGLLTQVFGRQLFNIYGFGEMYDYIKQRGYVLYPGKVMEAETFRVGNIGEIYAADIEAVSAIMKEFLQEVMA